MFGDRVVRGPNAALCSDPAILLQPATPMPSYRARVRRPHFRRHQHPITPEREPDEPYVADPTDGFVGGQHVYDVIIRGVILPPRFRAHQTDEIVVRALVLRVARVKIVVSRNSDNGFAAGILDHALDRAFRLAHLTDVAGADQHVKVSSRRLWESPEMPIQRVSYPHCALRPVCTRSPFLLVSSGCNLGPGMIHPMLG